MVLPRPLSFLHYPGSMDTSTHFSTKALYVHYRACCRWRQVTFLTR